MAIKAMAKNSMDILNTVRDNMDPVYKYRIPEATATNIGEIRNAFTTYTPQLNQFIDALINRIGLVVIKNKTWENPLQRLKKGRLEFGDTIEEIFIDIVKAQHYTVEPPKNDNGDVFEVVRPNVKTYFHTINRQDVYPLTIRQAELLKAFTSYAQLDSFISKCFESLYTSANFDEFLIMKNLITSNLGSYNQVQITAPTTEATAKEFAIAVRAASTNLTILSNSYNAAGVFAATDRNRQILIIRSDYEARVSVDVLAYAFNMSKAELLDQYRIIVIDSFGDSDIVAILADEDLLMFYDNKFEMTEQHNAKHLYWNYFLHIWQVASISKFANAIAFVTSTVTPSISNVTLTPENVVMPKGTSQLFTAFVEALNGASRTVTYTVVGNDKTTGEDGTETPVSVNPDTKINANGLLEVSPNEANSSLTITATSTVDTTKTASTIVTLTPPIILNNDPAGN